MVAVGVAVPVTVAVGVTVLVDVNVGVFVGVSPSHRAFISSIAWKAGCPYVPKL